MVHGRRKGLLVVGQGEILRSVQTIAMSTAVSIRLAVDCGNNERWYEDDEREVGRTGSAGNDNEYASKMGETC